MRDVNPLAYRHLQTCLQKVAFCSVKGRLSPCKRPWTATRKAVFCKTIRVRAYLDYVSFW